METTGTVRTKKMKSVIEAEEEHLASISTKKVTRKKSKVSADLQNSDVTLSESKIDNNKDESSESLRKTVSEKKRKSKSKKLKKAETNSENISVKKSFNKFDELQKKNLIHSSMDEKDNKCRICVKPVYKMEEIKAEKFIFHKNCFRCEECKKILKIDSYQNHEGKLYCLPHFKMLFVPKIENNLDEVKPRQAELIIRENNPIELPPDVVRASNKPDLGLEELQQLNVRSRFEIFENGNWQKNSTEVTNQILKAPIEKSASIVSKLAKLQQHGCFVSEKNMENFEEIDPSDDSSDDKSDSGDDMDLVRSKKCTQKELPIGLGDAMSDIKSKFESGHLMSKEGRREERKQEIQNIRSRLFLGKQARIKEMYQQAVAEAEQGKASTSKKPDVELTCAAKTLKERFENGALFNTPENEGNGEKSKLGLVSDEADVFESAISKKSRSIFMELDANMTANKQNNIFGVNSSLNKPKITASEIEQEGNFENIVRYDTKPDDVKIETSELSEKFKFFETFRPPSIEKKEFRITPPREGVVKLPTPDIDEEEQTSTLSKDNILEKSQTTSKMLNIFREMEQNKCKEFAVNKGPRPLKCFTPPPDEGKRVYEDQGSDYESDEDLENDDYSEEEQNYNYFQNDVALKEAQLAARAKALRAKFEKWQSNEEEDGKNNSHVQDVFDDASIETTKTLRDRFENMNRTSEPIQTKTRYQVNRFI